MHGSHRWITLDVLQEKPVPGTNVDEARDSLIKPRKAESNNSIYFDETVMPFLTTTSKPSLAMNRQYVLEGQIFLPMFL